MKHCWLDSEHGEHRESAKVLTPTGLALHLKS